MLNGAFILVFLRLMVPRILAVQSMGDLGQVCVCMCVCRRVCVYIYIYIYMTLAVQSMGDMGQVYTYIHTGKHTYIQVSEMLGLPNREELGSYTYIYTYISVSEIL